MKPLEEGEIAKEIKDYPKPIVYESNKFPYNSLDDRQFEIMLYYLFKKELESGKNNKIFNNVTLMPGVGEEGRDVKLTLNGKNVGIVQCKKYNKRFTKPALAREIIKFSLHYIKNKSLVSNKNNFYYYIAVSNDFTKKALELIDDFNENIIEEPELENWINQVIKSVKALNSIKIQEIKSELFSFLRVIKITKITANDLNLMLQEYPEVAKFFFQIKIFILSNDPNSILDEYAIQKDNLDIPIIKSPSIITDLSHYPLPQFFYGRENELDLLKQVSIKNNSIIINGIAGIGKTFLIAKYANENKKKNIIWLDCNIYNQIEKVIMSLSHYFKDFHKNKSLFESLKNPNIESISRINEAVRLIEKYKCCLVIDNFDLEKNKSINRLLIECNKFLREGKIFIISRETLSLEEFSNLPFQITLSGLDKESCFALIQHFIRQLNLKTLNNEDLLSIFNFTNGHPHFTRLFILLLKWKSIKEIIDEFPKSSKYIDEYIYNEIWNKFDKKSVELLEKLSILRIPFSSSAAKYFSSFKDEYIFLGLIESILIRQWSQDSLHFEIHNLLKLYAQSKIPKTNLKKLHQLAVEYYRNESVRNLFNVFETIYHALKAELIEEAIEEAKLFLFSSLYFGLFDFVLEAIDQFLLNPHLSKIGFIHYIKGRILRIKQKLSDSLESYERALKYDDNFLSKDGIKYEIASILIKQSPEENFIKSKAIYQELLSSKILEIKTKAMATLGMIEVEYKKPTKEEIKDSIKLVTEALKIAKDNNLLRQISECYQILGIIYFFCDEFKEAIEYFKKSISYKEKYNVGSHDVIKDYHLYDKLAEAYEKINRFEEAIKFSQKCVELDRELLLNRRLARSLYYHGYLLCLNKNYEEAKNCLKESLRLGLSLNYSNEKITRTLYWLIFSLWNLKKFKNALERLLEYHNYTGKIDIPIVGVKDEVDYLFIFNGPCYALILPPNYKLNDAIKWFKEIIKRRPELGPELSKIGNFPRIGIKISRNEPCPCGSGKKYKFCHGKKY